MKAKFDSTKKDKFTLSHRKESKCHFESYAIITMGQASMPRFKAKIPVELRLYGTGNTNFACIWINNEKFGQDGEVCTHGSGRAGGYGYHRPSAAAGEAIRNAGFELLTDEGNPMDIGGVGEQAIEQALCAIADAIGIKDYALVRSHP